MIVPGSNLLRLAMGPIARQKLQHRAYISRTINAAGDYVSTFADPVDITGSFQPVNRSLYQQLGLNLEKNYSTLYTQANVMPTERDREGDYVVFGGSTWQCNSEQDWRAVDGWRKLLCVEVPGL
jgi:hypothetical protein